MAERAAETRGSVATLWAGLLYSYPLLLVIVLWEAVAWAGLVRPLFLDQWPADAARGDKHFHQCLRALATFHAADESTMAEAAS